MKIRVDKNCIVIIFQLVIICLGAIISIASGGSESDPKADTTPTTKGHGGDEWYPLVVDGKPGASPVDGKDIGNGWKKIEGSSCDGCKTNEQCYLDLRSGTYSSNYVFLCCNPLDNPCKCKSLKTYSDKEKAKCKPLLTEYYPKRIIPCFDRPKGGMRCCNPESQQIQIEFKKFVDKCEDAYYASDWYKEKVSSAEHEESLPENECNLNSDCSEGQYCDDGKCTADCREDRDCPEGNTCDTKNGKCILALP